ncbi:MAG: 16S rRNA (adenine(1518)-N(6)/adenine(1519)-N(6))-dimethyltransferase RsmA, partial [Clostridia bacterium]
MNLTDLGTIKTLCAKYGFSFSKGLGQNFLIDAFVPQEIAEMSSASGIGVIEIGAGMGTLTVELANIAKKVVTIEIDKSLIPVLNETLSEYDNIKVVNADVLQTDLHKLIEEEFSGMEVVVCANLPYYITSPIVMYLLEQKLPIKSITVMVQKEVAKRLCGTPTSGDYGAISLSVAYYAKGSILFDVAPSSFYPAPKVVSSVIQLDILEKPPVNVDEDFFFKFIKTAFLQRRKTLANAISNGFAGSISKTSVCDALLKIGKPQDARGETLTLKDFEQL